MVTANARTYINHGTWFQKFNNFGAYQTNYLQRQISADRQQQMMERQILDQINLWAKLRAEARKSKLLEDYG